MEIAFRVRDVEVPEAVRHRTRDRVERLAVLCGSSRVVVCFSEERNPRIAEREVCQVTLFGQGRTLRVHAAAKDVTVAAERVVAKLEQRATRLRGRKSRRQPAVWCAVALPAAASGDGWVHFPTNRSTARREPGAVDLLIGGGGQGAGAAEGEAVTGAMTPEEAALEMAEQGRDLLFFVNAETGRPAVVYSRKDGDIAFSDAATARRALRW